MSTSEKHSESDRTSRESEVGTSQGQSFVYASLSYLTSYSQQAAEERYSHEVLAHAESIKAIETLKRQFTDIQVTARGNLAAAETATAKLAASEGSWKQQKEALDKEMADLNIRLFLFLFLFLRLHTHVWNNQMSRSFIPEYNSPSAPRDSQLSGCSYQTGCRCVIRGCDCGRRGKRRRGH
jgi:nucleoprotein TPR